MKNIVFLALVILLITLGGAAYYFLPSQQQGEEVVQEPAQEARRSISGQVVSIDLAANSFVLRDADADAEFTVELGAATEITRLSFPFDPANPPEGQDTFVPQEEAAQLADLKTGEFVFVRSSHAVEPGGTAQDPIEVQVLP